MSDLPSVVASQCLWAFKVLATTAVRHERNLPDGFELRWIKEEESKLAACLYKQAYDSRLEKTSCLREYIDLLKQLTSLLKDGRSWELAYLRTCAELTLSTATYYIDMIWNSIRPQLKIGTMIIQKSLTFDEQGNIAEPMKLKRAILSKNARIAELSTIIRNPPVNIDQAYLELKLKQQG